MLVLVTGAAGFAGYHIVRQLISCGYKVRGMIEPGDSAVHLKSLRCETAEADLLDFDSLYPALEKCDCVIHAAGNVSMRVSARKRMRAINVSGTENIISAAQAAKVKRFVHISSVGVLGALDFPGIMDENNPAPDYGNQGHYYNQTKIDGEKIALLANDKNFEVIAVMPGMLFGTHDFRMSSTGVIMNALQNGLIFYPKKGGTSLTNVEDLARGVVMALENGKPGERYIIAGENIMISELYEMIAREAGNAKAVMVPLFVITVFCLLCEILGRAGFDVDFSMDVRRMAGNYWWHTSEKARRELGFEPEHKAADTIKETVKWYKEYYLSKQENFRRVV